MARARSITLTASVTPEIMDFLEKMAPEMGMTVSSLTRNIIADYISERVAEAGK